MTALFYMSALIAVFATAMTISRHNAIHALLYFIVSLFAVAMIFFLLGAPFVAALEVIVYAGAIMVLFVFVVMLLNLGREAVEQERRWLQPGMWVGPGALAAVLLLELVYLLLTKGAGAPATAGAVGPREVGRVLLGPYLLGVELASMLLLAGLVGAYHLGRREKEAPR